MLRFSFLSFFFRIFLLLFFFFLVPCLFFRVYFNASWIYYIFSVYCDTYSYEYCVYLVMFIHSSSSVRVPCTPMHSLPPSFCLLRDITSNLFRHSSLAHYVFCHPARSINSWYAPANMTITAAVGIGSTPDALYHNAGESR